MGTSLKYLQVSLTISFICLTLNWGLTGVTVLFLSTIYYAYWALNHEVIKHKLEALIYYFLLLLMTISTFTAIYEMEGIICSGELVKSTYESFYFSIVTWTTLGYGDCLPTKNIRHVAAIQALMGYLMMAIFISIFMSLISNNSEP